MSWRGEFRKRSNELNKKIELNEEDLTTPETIENKGSNGRVSIIKIKKTISTIEEFLENFSSFEINKDLVTALKKACKELKKEKSLRQREKKNQNAVNAVMDYNNSASLRDPKNIESCTTCDQQHISHSDKFPSEPPSLCYCEDHANCTCDQQHSPFAKGKSRNSLPLPFSDWPPFLDFPHSKSCTTILPSQSSS